MASHNDGINALPKWTADTKYDWRNYGPEQKAARAKFVEERRAADIARQAASQAKLKQTLRDVAKFIASKIDPKKANTAQRKFLGLQWDGASTCFSDLEYSRIDGGVWATFKRDGSTYFYALSRSEAKQFFEAPSVGGFFNDEIR
jgi:hypothetical protein